MSANLKVSFANGQSVNIRAKGKFTMAKPDVIMLDRAFRGPPMNMWVTPWNGMHLGIIRLGIPGSSNNMSFRVQVISPKCGGEAKITQLCSINATALVDINVANVLDNVDPYPNTVITVLTNHINPFNGRLNNIINLDDAPQGGWFDSFHYSGNFVDYVMFAPDGDSIYVPLGKITWSTSFGANYPSPVISPNSVEGPSDPDGSTEFPEWTEVFSNSN